MTNAITKIDLALKPRHEMNVNGNILRADDGGRNFSVEGVDGSLITDPTEVAQAVADAREAFQAFGAAFAAEAEKLQNAAKVMASMSGVATASSVANDNTVDVERIGYVTKEGMQLFGISKDAETGQKTYHYTKRIGHMTWRQADQAIEKLNRDTTLTSTYGNASFPTDRTTNTNELGMMFKEQKALGIKDDFIHGEGLGVYNSRYLGCNYGGQHDGSKGSYAAAFPSWRVKHSMI